MAQQRYNLTLLSADEQVIGGTSYSVAKNATEEERAARREAAIVQWASRRGSIDKVLWQEHQ